MASKAGKRSTSATTTVTPIPGDQVTSSEPSRPSSPLSPTRITRLQEKAELSHLNDRFANYIDRVRQLETENSRLSLQVHSSHESTSREIISIKSLYEKELNDTRKLLDETARDKAKLQIEANKLNVENDELNAKLGKKEKDFAALDKRVINLESQIDELKGRLNQAVAERKRAEDGIKEANSENEKLEKQLGTIRAQLQEETLLRVDLENRLQSLKEELQFKQSVHEKEIQESRVYRETEMSEMVSSQLKEQYEQRLADELRELREENELQLKQNREDMEMKYETQLADLQALLDQKVASFNSNRGELQSLKSKVESLISKNSQLESVNQSLVNRVKDLEQLIEQERQWNDAAIRRKDEELANLREDVKNIMNDYQDLLDIKIALDMEINAYRKLLEGEESRLNLSSPSSPSVQTTRVASPRSYTPSARGNKRKRTVYLQEEENIVDVLVNSNAKSDVEINDHDQEGKYVKLYNKGDKEVSLSGWQLIRNAGNFDTHFKFHRSIVIKPSAYVTVWSADTNTTHSPPSDLVMKGQTWFIADTMKTTLLNNTGEEMAVRETSKRQRSTLSHRTSEGGLQNDVHGNQERCSIM